MVETSAPINMVPDQAQDSADVESVLDMDKDQGQSQDLLFDLLPLEEHIKRKPRRPRKQKPGGSYQAKDLPFGLPLENPIRRKRGRPPKNISGPGLNMGQNPIQTIKMSKIGRPLKPIFGPGKNMGQNPIQNINMSKRGRHLKPIFGSGLNVGQNPIQTIKMSKRGRPLKQIFGSGLNMGKNPIQTINKSKRGSPPMHISGPGLNMGQGPMKRKVGRPRKHFSGPSVDVGQEQRRWKMTSKADQVSGTRRQIGVGRDGDIIFSVLIEKGKEQLPYSGRRPDETPQNNNNSGRNDHVQEGADRTTHVEGQSPARSLVNMIKDLDVIDEEETESDVPDGEVPDGMVQVGSYRVRENMSHTLQDILDKQGDIAEDFKLESDNLLSATLENICGVVQKLKTTTFVEVRRKHLDGFDAVVRDAETLSVNVKWLRELVDKIRQKFEAFNLYIKFEENKRKSSQRIKSIEEALELKKAEIKVLEGQLEAEKLIFEKLDDTKDDRWKGLCNTCLSNGML